VGIEGDYGKYLVVWRGLADPRGRPEGSEGVALHTSNCPRSYGHSGILREQIGYARSRTAVEENREDRLPVNRYYSFRRVKARNLT
jgi:hypothetical protein